MQDKPSDYPKVGILKALVTKAIVWDNCEGGFATMAQPGQIIDVTKDDDEEYTIKVCSDPAQVKMNGTERY